MERFLLTAGVIATVCVVFLLMFWGWQNAARRAAHIAEPPEPVDAPIVAGPWHGRFLGTTYAGRWLDRIHAHTLGDRSEAEVSVTTHGINVQRVGARSFAIAQHDLLGVRADSGIAGRAYGTAGIVVITFRLGSEQLEFGVRFPNTADQLAALAAITPSEVSS